MPPRVFLARLLPALLISFLGFPSFTHADDMAEMQKKLNAETMDKPFQVEDAAKVDSYIQDAMKKDLKPNPTAPSNWAPGYTCDSYYHRYSYNYYGYRDCRYYYGRYW